ncbi:hypothetical protein [Aminobacter sp. AP02]|uniref:hypothetical protein n=1 Tax=Aminobacter sp. AP02 TaxID=2135737 RepID=UPI000D792A43|nr:hypothetical protein [Aminobacter sp. AP02]PWK64639.1 hypothetical protein C8K44_11980 [Aminobacter sp. AP02]
MTRIPSILYDVPVTVHHDGERLPSRLTVARRVDGEFWEGRVYTRPDLHMTMDQVATPRNGGFGHLSYEDFLHHVRVVFSFAGGAHFDFADDEFGPTGRGLH